MQRAYLMSVLFKVCLVTSWPLELHFVLLWKCNAWLTYMHSDKASPHTLQHDNDQNLCFYACINFFNSFSLGGEKPQIFPGSVVKKRNFELKKFFLIGSRFLHWHIYHIYLKHSIWPMCFQRREFRMFCFSYKIPYCREELGSFAKVKETRNPCPQRPFHVEDNWWRCPLC